MAARRAHNPKVAGSSPALRNQLFYFFMGDDMIKINKYLEELGYIQEDLPGHYDKQCKDFDKPYNDPRNQDMPEYGFSVYEFFNLDHTFDLLIYPRLCYFRDHCNVGSPGGMSFEEWNNILDSMIEGFKLRIDMLKKYQSLN